MRAFLSDKKLSDYLRLGEGMPVLHLERRFETSRPGYSIYSSIYSNAMDQDVYGFF
jgi:GntR family transcriptional regulator/GntR family frlABCD operon transcriptional regulator